MGLRACPAVSLLDFRSLRIIISTSLIRVSPALMKIHRPDNSCARGGPKQKSPGPESGAFCFKSGDDLLSHVVANAVPSALEGLTSVFGMGTGVAPPLESPENEILAGRPESRPVNRSDNNFVMPGANQGARQEFHAG